MAATNYLIPDFEDFERYYRGDMPTVEQRALEGRMLAEPLVAEAYEGFLAWRAQHTDAAGVRADLHERLHTRVAPARGKALPLWAYASAASVMLALLSYWFVFLRDQKESVQKHAVAATREEAKPEVTKQVPAPAIIRQDEPVESVASAPVSPKASNQPGRAQANRPEQTPKSLPKPEIALAPSVLAHEEVREEASDIAADSFLAETETSKASAQPAKGLDAPGSVQAVGKSMQGRERMQQKDSETNYLVASKPVSAKKDAYNVTVLPDTLAPVPAEGWPAYRIYLDKNTGSASKTGQVLVTFVVSSSGTLSGFTAKGPEDLQKEAIRIIGSGPAWSPARTGGRSVSSTTEIQLQFRSSQ